MKLRLTLPAFALIATAFIAAPVTAENLTAEFDEKHKDCLERIALDAGLAFEEAMIWRGDGGGRRARHCEAMALFALGHEGEAARRLDALAASPDGGNAEMRANFYAEAGNFWLTSNEPNNAFDSASAGLKLRKDNVDLRIIRARSYAKQGRYDYAETDLTSALAFNPRHAAALRYRADARFQQGKLQEAKTDIEKSLIADPESVETALLRGHINEALRENAVIKVDKTKRE